MTAADQTAPSFANEVRRPRDEWLGRRGIYRHQLRDIGDAYQAAHSQQSPAVDVVSTVHGAEWNGFGECPATVIGELRRLVSPDGTVTYEATVSPLDDSTDDVDPFLIGSLESLSNYAKVVAELRYEWAEMTVWRRG